MRISITPIGCAAQVDVFSAVVVRKKPDGVTVRWSNAENGGPVPDQDRVAVVALFSLPTPDAPVPMLIEPEPTISKAWWEGEGMAHQPLPPPYLWAVGWGDNPTSFKLVDRLTRDGEPVWCCEKCGLWLYSLDGWWRVTSREVEVRQGRLANLTYGPNVLKLPTNIVCMATKRYLSILTSGYVTVCEPWDRTSNRQQFIMHEIAGVPGAPPTYYIAVKGPIQGKPMYLSCTGAGQAELSEGDDGSGRQMWILVPVEEEGDCKVYNILNSDPMIMGGRKLLSCIGNSEDEQKEPGSKRYEEVFLTDRDDSSGNQRWIITLNERSRKYLRPKPSRTVRCVVPFGAALGCTWADTQGTLILDVEDGTPAKKAGLVTGELVIAVTGAQGHSYHQRTGQVKAADEAMHELALAPVELRAAVCVARDMCVNGHARDGKGLMRAAHTVVGVAPATCGWCKRTVRCGVGGYLQCAAAACAYALCPACAEKPRWEVTLSLPRTGVGIGWHVWEATNQIARVDKNSPAADAKLRGGHKIIAVGAVDDTQLTSVSDRATIDAVVESMALRPTVVDLTVVDDGSVVMSGGGPHNGSSPQFCNGAPGWDMPTPLADDADITPEALARQYAACEMFRNQQVLVSDNEELVQSWAATLLAAGAEAAAEAAAIAEAEAIAAMDGGDVAVDSIDVATIGGSDVGGADPDTDIIAMGSDLAASPAAAHDPDPEELPAAPSRQDAFSDQGRDSASSRTDSAKALERQQSKQLEVVAALQGLVPKPKPAALGLSRSEPLQQEDADAAVVQSNMGELEAQLAAARPFAATDPAGGALAMAGPGGGQ